MIIKQIGSAEVLMDFSVNAPMGYVYADGKWHIGPITDISADINVNEYMAARPESIETITEEPSAVS